MSQVAQLTQMFWNPRKGDFTHNEKIIKLSNKAVKSSLRKKKLCRERGEKKITPEKQSTFACEQTKSIVLSYVLWLELCFPPCHPPKIYVVALVPNTSECETT